MTTRRGFFKFLGAGVAAPVAIAAANALPRDVAPVVEPRLRDGVDFFSVGPVGHSYDFADATCDTCVSYWPDEHVHRKHITLKDEY